MLLWIPSVEVLLVLAISSLQVILSGATVAVGTSSLYADEESNHIISCTSTEAIRFLRWFKASNNNQEFADAQRILELFVFANSVTFGNGVDASHYSFNESALDYPLTINGVGLDDELSYWCEVVLDSGGPNEVGQTSFKVRRIPASIVLEHAGTSYTESGREVNVTEGKNQFKCSVPNIKPAAKFTWKLGSKDLNSFEESNETNDDPRLVNSYSTLTVNVSKEDSDSELTCSAQNKQDGTTTPDQTINIMLRTMEDPCSEGPCKNGGTCSAKADKYQCKCVDGFTGPTCSDADTTTSMTPQNTTTPPSSSQETTVSPTGPTETTSDLGPTSTESPTTINTGTRGSSTTPTGSSEMPTRSSEMTTGSTKMTTGSTEMTNSTYPLTPSTTAHTPETTPTGCTTLCDEATGLSIGIIIGIVVGSLCVVVITVGVGIAILKYNSKNGVTPDSNQSKKGKKKEAIEEEHV